MNKLLFNKIYLDNFHNWPVFLKYFMLVFFLFLLVLFNYCLILRSNINQYNFLMHKESHLKVIFERKHQIANLSAYKKQLEFIKKKHKKFLNLLARKRNSSLLLNELRQAGLSLNLIFEHMAPRLKKVKSKNDLIVIFELIGEYYKLAKFVHKVACFKRIISFERFEISKTASRGHQVNNQLRMKITAKIYQA